MPFAEKHIDLLRHLSAETIIGPGEPDKWSKPFWFRYFWQEARSQKAKFLQNWRPIIAFFDAAFQLPAIWNDQDPGFRRELFTDSAGLLTPKSEQALVTSLTPKSPPVWGTIADGTLRAVLMALMESGFTRVAVSNLGPNKIRDTSLTFSANSHHIQADGGTYYFDIGWRGDGRRLDEITQAGGFVNRAESEYQGFAKQCGLREDWNPFNDTSVRADYWFREGQGDNCLHATVSVALQFQTAATFPLIESNLAHLQGRPFPTTHQAAFQASTPSGPLMEIGVEVENKTQYIYRYADRQQLYMLILDTECFDTRKKQAEKFPEVGVKNVPANRVMACISFVRVFHGTTDDEGLTVLYDAKGSTAPTEDRCVAACGDRQLGVLLYRRVLKAYSDTCASMPFGTKWTPSGASTGMMAPRLRVDKKLANVLTVRKLTGTALVPFWP